MRPEKIRITNFGPFAGTEEIDFSSLDDIFLITGKTGSGKTTIFDALCFALYGMAPGSRRFHVSRLRSDYAGEDAECSVSLEFSVREKRYRVDRSPKQEKRKKRGTGTTTIDESAVLYKMAGKNLVSLSARKSEADEKIRELIGLEAEEFFKIVILPQGEFAEFLRQNTTERRAVLGKLFPVDKAVRVRELAQEKARDIQGQVKEAERALGEIMKRVSFENYGELHAQAQKTLKEAKERAAALEEETARLRELLVLRQNQEETAERLKGINEESARLDEARPVMEEKERRLSLSRKAQPLRHHLVMEEEKRREAEKGSAELETAAIEKEAAEKAVVKTENHTKLVPGLEQEERRLREKRPVLEEMLREEELLRRNREEEAALEEAVRAANEEKEELCKKLEAKEAEIHELQTLAGEAGELEGQWEQARNTKDRLIELKHLAAEGEKLMAAEKAGAEKAGALGKRRAELEGRVPVLRDELQRLETEKQLGEQADMAACLSALLKRGEPCPVCGSREHPCPAVAGPAFAIPQRLETLRGSLMDAEKERALLVRELETSATEALNRQEALNNVREAIRLPAPGKTGGEDPGISGLFAGERFFPPEAEVSLQLENCLARLNGISARRDEALRAGNRVPGLYRERDVLQSRKGELERHLAGLFEKQRGLAAAAGELRKKHARLLSSGEQAAMPGSGHPDERARGALKELDRLLHEVEGQIAAYRKEQEEAGRRLAAAVAREKAARERRDRGEQQYQEAEAALIAALRASPFSSAGALKEALMDSAGEAALEAAFSRWKEELARLHSQRDELEARLENLEKEAAAKGGKTSAGETRRALETLRQNREQAETRREEAQGELAALERDWALLQEARQQHAALAEKSARLGALADDLAGRNPKKRAFDAWLLGHYLAEVAALATKRLERMSEYRYSLLLDSEGEAARGRTGLDLAVFDAHTGKTRPCATLSGGESFMASISLALGLAGSIEARAGGVRLDAVFIDEGFGSLDEASLDKALIILDELRDHRMVGLISHVGELRTRVPCRLEVIKGGGGSTIHLEQGPR